MVTIIRPGFRSYVAYVFECPRCGCVARVTRDELFPYTEEFICPYCGMQAKCEPVTEQKEIKLEGYDIKEYPFVLVRDRKQEEK